MEWFALLMILAVYFLPTMVAAERRVSEENAIGLVNLLLGWTFVGWLVCLIWAFAAKKPPRKPRKSDRLQTLQAAKDDGTITEAEFQELRDKTAGWSF